MKTNPPGAFRWTARREEAAHLVAEDRQLDHEIAAKVGITKRALEGWKRQPAFQERVAGIVEATREALLREGIAHRQIRLEAIKDLFSRLRRVIEARAEQFADIPGGDTGLLVRTFKVIGTGQAAERVEEAEVDTGLLREARELIALAGAEADNRELEQRLVALEESTARRLIP